MVQDDQDLRQKIVKLLDELIQGGKWEGSLFLETWGKKFRDMRDRLNTELGISQSKAQSPTSTENVVKKEDFLEVFVSLYQSDGLSIKKWEALLATLGEYNVSRPVYKSEVDVKDLIRNKPTKQNDGYAVIKILQEEVLPLPPNTQASLDRLGHELMNLKEGAIKQKNIIRFVHQTGVYSYTNGTLIRQSADNPF